MEYITNPASRHQDTNPGDAHREPVADGHAERTERQWNFSGPATMVRISLMYYVDFYSLFNNPEKDWEKILAETSEMPPELTLFD